MWVSKPRSSVLRRVYYGAEKIFRVLFSKRTQNFGLRAYFFHAVIHSTFTLRAAGSKPAAVILFFFPFLLKKKVNIDGQAIFLSDFAKRRKKNKEKQKGTENVY